MTIVRTRTPSGEAIAILRKAEFERLRAGTEELLSEADLDALRAAPSPFAFWQARRGASIARLAQVCALDEDEISALERGVGTTKLVVYERLARALDVDVEDLVPEAA